MKKALVVDDSRAMRAILRGFLTDLGFSVSESPDGAQALAFLKKNGPVDLALVDWNMPEMNGLDLVKALRADSTFKNMFIMMCTTETEMSQVATALSAGANEYVMKPFTRDVISDKIGLLRAAA